MSSFLAASVALAAYIIWAALKYAPAAAFKTAAIAVATTVAVSEWGESAFVPAALFSAVAITAVTDLYEAASSHGITVEEIDVEVIDIEAPAVDADAPIAGDWLPAEQPQLSDRRQQVIGNIRLLGTWIE